MVMGIVMTIKNIVMQFMKTLMMKMNMLTMMMMMMWISRGRSGFSNQSRSEHQRGEHFLSYSIIAFY